MSAPTTALEMVDPAKPSQVGSEHYPGNVSAGVGGDDAQHECDDEHGSGHVIMPAQQTHHGGETAEQGNPCQYKHSHGSVAHIIFRPLPFRLPLFFRLTWLGRCPRVGAALLWLRVALFRDWPGIKQSGKHEQQHGGNKAGHQPGRAERPRKPQHQLPAEE